MLQRPKDKQLPRPTSFNGKGFFSVLEDQSATNQADTLIQRETAALVALDHVV